MNVKVVMGTGCAERRQLGVLIITHGRECSPQASTRRKKKKISSKEVQERQDSFKLYNQRDYMKKSTSQLGFERQRDSVSGKKREEGEGNNVSKGTKVELSRKFIGNTIKSSLVKAGRTGKMSVSGNMKNAAWEHTVEGP